MNRITACLTAILITLSSSYTPADSVEAEVVHWWYKGGDAQALQTIVEAFESRGGTWLDAGKTDFYTTREAVVSRLAKGYPPTATQWNAGIELTEFAQLGLLNIITAPTQQNHIRQHYYPSVLDWVTVNDQIIAVPVTVHNESWLWYNMAAFAGQQLSPPQSLVELQQVTQALESQGITALAVGSEAWQHRIVFMNILLATTDKNGFNKLFFTLDADYLDSDEFATVITSFTGLAAHVRSFGTGSWSDQIAAVHRGEAAMTYMGDWAKGEFQALGGKQGEHFSCHPAPGVDYLQPVIDVFFLGGTDAPKELASQHTLTQALLDTDSIIAFNKIKGSVPPFPVPDQTRSDQCESHSYKLLKQKQRTLAPFASLGDGRHHGLVQEAIRTLWQDGKDSWPAARELWLQAMTHERARRSRLGNAMSVSGITD
ncbi:MAG: ABC transporter substrate-binding protein [Pseudomonadota bacterium]